MQAERTFAVLVAALTIGALTPSVHAEPPGYGKVETFQPGKKYNCVPAADGKGWDCKEIGKADARAPDSTTARPANPVDAAQTPSTPSPASSPGETAPVNDSTDATPAPSALPSYLTNASAAGNPPPSPAPAVAAPASRAVTVPAKRTDVSAHAPAVPVEAATKSPSTATPHDRTRTVRPSSESARLAPEPSRSPATTPAPTPAPAQSVPVVSAASPAPPTTPADRASQHDFLALPGNHFVIELAHAEHEGDLANARDAAHLPSGQVYELHLRENDADQWLLVWGDFDSIEAARAARAELLANGTMSPGWPRRIAPLQAEVRRAQQ